MGSSMGCYSKASSMAGRSSRMGLHRPRIGIHVRIRVRIRSQVRSMAELGTMGSSTIVNGSQHQLLRLQRRWQRQRGPRQWPRAVIG